MNGYEYAKALAVFDTLPDSLKRERAFLQERYIAAKGNSTSDPEQDLALYQRALEELTAVDPEDPATALVSLGGHLSHKDYDAAIKAIDLLYRRARDPYLHMLRGNALLEKGDRAKAKTEFRKAIAGERTLQPPYWVLITMTMEDKSFKETAQLLTAIERDAGVSLKNLEGAQAFEPFVQSPEYKAWKKGRAK